MIMYFIEKLIISSTSEGMQLEIKQKNENLISNNPDCELKEELETGNKVYLNKERGMKIDFIRVINSLYELGFAVDENGKKAMKKDVFIAFGKALNIDLSNYSTDLSSSLSDGTSMKKHLKIFEDMLEVMKRTFNLA
jgi:hypothetical protein